MQTVSTQFQNLSEGDVRPLSKACLISFEKDYDPLVEFYTVGVSAFDGGAIFKGDFNTIQEWDKYTYTDYTDRVISMEWDREATFPTNPITRAVATIVLDNYDDLFTPGNTNSALEPYLIPRRPVRLYAGFDGELIPVFIGMTEGRPEVDESSRTVRLRCVDFLTSILEMPLQREVMYVNQREDQVIQGILESCGLVASQFDLDYGEHIIPFAYFKKDSKAGIALEDIGEATLGNLSMREDGVIQYKTRSSWASNTPVITLTKEDNIIERKNAGRDNVINVVEVKSNAREVQDIQKIWEQSNETEVPAGETIEIFAEFRDDEGELPVTTAEDPTYVDTATTSVYATNKERDGSGPTLDSDISLDSMDLFSTGAKLTFTNSGSTNIFLTRLEVWGTPARIRERIYVRVQDDASVGDRDAYEERVHTIENDYIQDPVTANSIAQIILEDCAEDDDQVNLYLKGLPQLQVGDVATYDDEDQTTDYFITRINGIFNNSGLRQYLRVSKRTINIYYRIGISAIDGTDVIAP